MAAISGDAMQALRASSSARMVDALLESIADDPVSNRQYMSATSELLRKARLW